MTLAEADTLFLLDSRKLAQFYRNQTHSEIMQILFLEKFPFFNLGIHSIVL